ncbi:hypothetical protein [Roseateles chitinivorans]
MLKSKWATWVVGAGVLVKVGLLVVAVDVTKDADDETQVCKE